MLVDEYLRAIAAAYAAWKLLHATTDEERAHFDWMGYIGNFVAISAFLGLGVEALGCEFRSNVSLGPALHEGLGLGEKIGHELGVVVAQRVLRFTEADEVARDEFGSLMDELIEGMLAIGADLTPEHRACMKVDVLAIAIDKLTITFHVSLLQVGR